MSRLPPHNTQGGGKGMKSSTSISVESASNEPSTAFKGPNAKNIKKCSTMYEISWDSDINADTFPEFNDGYREDLFFDDFDQSALMEESELARQSEMFERHERRRRLQAKYREAKARRSAMNPNQQPPANDVIVGNNGAKYQIIKLLGQGQFGVVYAATEFTSPNEEKPKYAIKVAKPGEMYRQQAQREVQILKHLQKTATQAELAYCLRLVDWFIFMNRLCIVNEMLSMNLYEIIKARQFKGLPLGLIQSVMRQLLFTLKTLEKCKIVHSDIKPENILLIDMKATDIKLVDFGSARFIQQPASNYIQSRYYRAPEVVLNLDHDYKIDIWSAACVAFELFIALPLFPGQNEIHLLELIVGLLGDFPPEVVRKSPRQNFFQNGKLKSEEQICRENNMQPVNFQNYFNNDKLDDIILKYELLLGNTPQAREKERKRRLLFIDFLRKTLNLNPEKRLSATEALQHPFITTDLTKI